MTVTGDEDHTNFGRGLQLATRSAVSATLAFSIAEAMKSITIFALAAAMNRRTLSQPKRESAVFAGWWRQEGGQFGALAASMNWSEWAVGPSILIAMLICHGVGAYNGATMAIYICGIIVLLDNGTSPWHYAFFRTAETALGVLLAWGISYVPKLLRAE